MRTLGFSLIEIMVAVGLLSFIVLGLLAMFAQTQRAFKQSMTDNDLLETGRAMTDMLARELAEMRPANVSTAANFFVEYPQPGEPIYTPPVVQLLPTVNNPLTASDFRLNYLQPFFFLTRPGRGDQLWPERTWFGTGYYVVPDSPGSPSGPGIGIGTLYRYYGTNYVVVGGMPAAVSPTFLYQDFYNSLLTLRTTNVSRVAEGVVHMRARPFAANGWPIVSDGSSAQRTVYCTNALSANGPLYNWGGYRLVGQTTNRVNIANPICEDRYDRIWFMSNAVPAYVELELGILERQTYERYKALGTANPEAQLRFLSNHVAQVHIFRQRIPIQNVDPSVYR